MSRWGSVLLTSLLVSACGGHGGGDEDADSGTDPDVTDTDATTDPDATSDPDVSTEGCIDVDRDGHCRPADCDDEDPVIHPGHAEVCHNGLDDDCDGTVDEDCVSTASTYFVDTDSIGGTCSDSNPGTETEPWCTVDQANSTLEAGDTVYIRAGTYSNETIDPASSGTEGSRITYVAHEGESVTFTASVYCVRIDDASYISVLGIDFLDCERNLYITGSDHINVGYCTFDNPAGPTTWAGSRVRQGSTHNRIFNCTFSRYGEQSGSSGAWDDHACILDIGNDNEVDESDHNLVINSTFFHGGHHILGVYANHNIVRGNTFHNENWYDCHRSSIGGLCGNRNVILNTSDPSMNVYNVIEENMIVFSGVPPDQDTSTGLSVRTRHNIIRRNTFYHNDASGLALSNDGGSHNDASSNHIYANVFFHNGYPAFTDWDPQKSGLLLARWVDDSDHLPMTGVAIKNNIFHENQLFGIYYYYVDETEQDVAGNREEEGDPLFVSTAGTPDPSDFTVYDFHLQSTSHCIDGGGFLTVTTSEGTDSTSLEVEDSGYFTDGEGLVSGDMIQLEGQDTAVLVTAVDHSTSTLTLGTPLTWTEGTGVSLPYSGSGPDQGVHEYTPL
jgi:hypothetical protein